MKRTLFLQMYPQDEVSGYLTPLNRLIIIMIAVSIIWAILGTESTLTDEWPVLFHDIDVVFGGFFLIEYLARLWVIGLNPKFSGWKGRLRYMVTPFALIDLFVVLSFVVSYVGASNSFILRLLRVLRILALAKLGRFSKAILNVGAALAGSVCLGSDLDL